MKKEITITIKANVNVSDYEVNSGEFIGDDAVTADVILHLPDYITREPVEVSLKFTEDAAPYPTPREGETKFKRGDWVQVIKKNDLGPGLVLSSDNTPDGVDEYVNVSWCGYEPDEEDATGLYQATELIEAPAPNRVGGLDDPDDPVDLRVNFNHEALGLLNYWTKHFTAYPTFRDLVNAFTLPTLRLNPNLTATMRERKGMSILRNAYFIATGTEAAK